MDKHKIIRKWKSGERKTVVINMRITKTQSLWLKKNNYSPTGIFNEACKDLGYKEQKK